MQSSSKEYMEMSTYLLNELMRTYEEGIDPGYISAYHDEWLELQRHPDAII